MLITFSCWSEKVLDVCESTDLKALISGAQRIGATDAPVSACVNPILGSRVAVS